MGTVSCGGSLLAPRPFPGEQGIEYVCLDVELANLDEALTVLKEKMHELGAPVGSSIAYYTGKFWANYRLNINNLLASLVNAQPGAK